MSRSGCWKKLLMMCLVGVLCGCAAQQRAVTFNPKATLEHAKESLEPKLEDMTYTELLARGDGYFAQGNLALAKLHFLQALTRKTPDPPLFVRLGNIFLKEGLQQKAQESFEEALRIEPDSIPALLGRARSARLAGNCPAAEPYLQHLQQLAPEHPEALTELAICYDSQGRFAEAENLYLQVAVLLPNQPAALNNLGFHFLLQGDFTRAAEVLKNARKLAGQNRMIKNNLAAAYILSGKEGSGLALFKNNLGKAEAFNNIGYIRMMRGELKQAEQAFLQALEFRPSYYVRAAKNLDYLRSVLSEDQAGFGDGVSLENTTAIN